MNNNDPFKKFRTIEGINSMISLPPPNDIDIPDDVYQIIREEMEDDDTMDKTD